MSLDRHGFRSRLINCVTFPPIGALGLLLFSAGGPVTAAAQEPTTLRLAPPDFEVGGYAADPGSEFANLGGVTLLGSGSVLVGDRVEPFLKVFSSDGGHIRDLGRSGEGPGEYQYVYELDWCAPGELSVFDADRRVHRYTGDTVLVATELVSLDAIGGGVGYHRDCHPNGYQIVTGWGDIQAQFNAGLYEATAPAVLLQGEHVVRNFGLRLSSQRLGSVSSEGSPTGSGPHPFGRSTVVALGSERVYIGDGRDYEIEVYDLSGETLAPIRWTGPSLRYDSDLVEELANQAISRASERSRPRLRRWYAELPELDQFPAYDRILVSDRDEVWVREFVRPNATGEEWVVFQADHNLMGRLSLPPRATLWEIRGDRVVYSVLDELDVPIVRISRVER